MTFIWTKRHKEVGIAMAMQLINGETYEVVAADWGMSISQVRTRVEHVMFRRSDNAPIPPGDDHPSIALSWARKHKDWWLKRLSEPEDARYG